MQGYLIGKPEPIQAYQDLVRLRSGDETVVRLHRANKRISA